MPMRAGVLELAKRAVAFEGLGQLGDALSSVGAVSKQIDPAERIVLQTAARKRTHTKGEHCQRVLTVRNAVQQRTSAPTMLNCS